MSSPLGQVIKIINSDGSVGQITVDSNGNLKVTGNLTVSGEAAVNPFDVTSTLTPAALSDDTVYRDAVTILAGAANSDIVKVGKTGSQTFPLLPGAGITLTKTQLSLIFHVAVSGSQVLHVICGGS
jgi:hypothetical protein